MEEERKDVATRYLRLVTKTLEPHQLLMLVRAKPCSNPLFLRMTCDEMIASAVFETVETTISQPFHPVTFRNACVRAGVVSELVQVLLGGPESSTIVGGAPVVSRFCGRGLGPVCRSCLRGGVPLASAWRSLRGPGGSHRAVV